MALGYGSRMSAISGRASADIDAPIDVAWALVADVERAPEWQGGLDTMRPLEHDAEGRPTLCETTTDAKVKVISSQVRFAWDGAPNRLSWAQEKGDLKSVAGSWALEDLGEGRTRATYELDGDPGRMLGMLVKGPIEEQIRKLLIESRPGELKRALEGG